MMEPAAKKQKAPAVMSLEERQRRARAFALDPSTNGTKYKRTPTRDKSTENQNLLPSSDPSWNTQFSSAPLLPAAARCVSPHGSPVPVNQFARAPFQDAVGNNHIHFDSEEEEEEGVARWPDLESHLNRKAEEEAQKKLVAIAPSPEDLLQEDARLRLKKLKIPELKSILRTNRQHITGKKADLIARIIDGEENGRLSPCPECGMGRLKIMERAPHTVFCPGYFDGEGVVPCGFWCEAKDAPRRGEWIGGPNKKANNSKAALIQARLLFAKKTVSEMKAILHKNEQHVTGLKRELLDRVADGYVHGKLDACPDCRRGKLKICESDPETVHCRGHFDPDYGATVPCSFSCVASDAPRAGRFVV